ncbi:MAG: hypothetical protein KBF76_18245 [Verrucomicrobiales bacterium]|nr:hypothetical protein [Verrucomicrobiales bacterium]HQZ27522.1 hypothetical protein [Verrucomicrobiales bacterium]
MPDLTINAIVHHKIFKTRKGQRLEPIPDLTINAIVHQKIFKTRKGQRPEPMPDRGNAPGYNVPPCQKG